MMVIKTIRENQFDLFLQARKASRHPVKPRADKVVSYLLCSWCKFRNRVMAIEVRTSSIIAKWYVESGHDVVTFTS